MASSVRLCTPWLLLISGAFLLLPQAAAAQHYSFDLVIERADKVISRPSVSTIPGQTCSIFFGCEGDKGRAGDYYFKTEITAGNQPGDPVHSIVVHLTTFDAAGNKLVVTTAPATFSDLGAATVLNGEWRVNVIAK